MNSHNTDTNHSMHEQLKNLYADELDFFSERIRKTYRSDKDISYAEYENVHILPLIKVKMEGKAGNLFLGGVCDEKFKFIAGHKRKINSTGMNKECFDSYKPIKSNTISYLDEDVIYGGMLHGHFGHFITESMCRLWYAIKHKKMEQRIAFVTDDEFNAALLEIIYLTGIEQNDIIIINEPMRFKKVIIPDQSLYYFDCYSHNFNTPYDAIAKNIPQSPHKKIYLSRTQFDKKDMINEEYFESFYKELGFHIVYPEMLSFTEQISLISCAEQIVSTIGTLSHLSVFAKKGARVVTFIRVRSHFNKLQQMIFESREQKFTYVDTSFNFMPHEYGVNCFYMAPTSSWQLFIKDEYNLSTEFNLKEFLNSKESHLGDYAFKWFEATTRKINVQKVCKQPIENFVKELRKTIK